MFSDWLESVMGGVIGWEEGNECDEVVVEGNKYSSIALRLCTNSAGDMVFVVWIWTETQPFPHLTTRPVWFVKGPAEIMTSWLAHWSEGIELSNG